MQEGSAPAVSRSELFRFFRIIFCFSGEEKAPCQGYAPYFFNTWRRNPVCGKLCPYGRKGNGRMAETGIGREDRLRKETCRYLGCKNQEIDERTKEQIASCLEELERTAVPRFYSRICPLAFSSGQKIAISGFLINSQALYQNLKDCEQVILFAATLGIGVDMLLKRYSRLNMSRAVVLQAASSAMIEEVCDRENERLQDEFLQKGLYLRPRFSPGYGDFPLSFQIHLLGLLDAGKRVGITLTDSLLMLPSKSVTAVIGVGREDADCVSGGCAACGQKGCIYRKKKRQIQ